MVKLCVCVRRAVETMRENLNDNDVTVMSELGGKNNS